MTVRRLITCAVLAAAIIATCAFQSPPRPTENCTVAINGCSIQIVGSEGDWHVYCEKLGLESSGTTLCGPLQEVIDALP